MFDPTANGRMPSKIDLKTVVFLIALKLEDTKKTAVNSKFSQFQYLVIAMEVCNASEIFRTLINE